MMYNVKEAHLEMMERMSYNFHFILTLFIAFGILYGILRHLDKQDEKQN